MGTENTVFATYHEFCISSLAVIVKTLHCEALCMPMHGPVPARCLTAACSACAASNGAVAAKYSCWARSQARPFHCT